MRRARNDETGQALVETAVVVPLFLFTFLVLLQLMLVAHGRVLVDYAAFNACRAGVVNNGNPQVMRSAAFLSVLPMFGKTDTAENFLATWRQLEVLEMVGTAGDVVTGTLEKAASKIFHIDLNGALPSLEIVHVETLNPRTADFDGDAQEIDLDLAQQTYPEDVMALSKTRLSIRVRVLFPLTIPLANRLLFYGFMAAMYFNAQETNDQGNDSSNALVGWLDPRMKLRSGGGGDTPAKFMDEHNIPTNVPSRPLELPSDVIMYNALKRLPSLGKGWFVMPLYAFYSMPMESNYFKGNLTPGIP